MPVTLLHVGAASENGPAFELPPGNVEASFMLLTSGDPGTQTIEVSPDGGTTWFRPGWAVSAADPVDPSNLGTAELGDCCFQGTHIRNVCEGFVSGFFAVYMVTS